MTTWLICGGRGYKGRGLRRTLDSLAADRGPPDLVVVGASGDLTERGLVGADLIGWWWAVEHEIDSHTRPARWKREGRAAGPIRNQRQIDEEVVDLCVAAPGGRGTADMVRRARKAGIEVVEVGA